ncbi:hypothetical protein [uncultured Robinsoniella sp.]|uniref:hypothetical protein n=1 Tax=uncultured Robinsoniella sp. TaxID=904190 RepID=UPI00290DB31D|nr:hypothetical protein [Clostridiales bacterium]
MTREQIKEQFPDATDDQITAILNINGGDLTAAKKNNIDPKELKRLQEIETEYSKLKDADLTDAEKIQKALDEAAEIKVNYTKKSNKLEAEKILVGAGLTEEDYKDLIDGLVSEDCERTKTMSSSLASLLSKQKEATAQKVKEDLMDATKIPGGSGSGDPKDEKSEDVKFAEDVAFSFGMDNKNSQSVFANY